MNRTHSHAEQKQTHRRREQTESCRREAGEVGLGKEMKGLNKNKTKTQFQTTNSMGTARGKGGVGGSGSGHRGVNSGGKTLDFGWRVAGAEAGV